MLTRNNKQHSLSTIFAVRVENQLNNGCNPRDIWDEYTRLLTNLSYETSADPLLCTTTTSMERLEIYNEGTLNEFELNPQNNNNHHHLSLHNNHHHHLSQHHNLHHHHRSQHHNQHHHPSLHHNHHHRLTRARKLFSCPACPGRFHGTKVLLRITNRVINSYSLLTCALIFLLACVNISFGSCRARRMWSDPLTPSCHLGAQVVALQ